MTPMITKDAHEYGGRQLKVGETFDAEDEHVELLKGLGRADVATGQSAEYQTRDLAAAPAAPYRRKVLTTSPRR